MVRMSLAIVVASIHVAPPLPYLGGVVVGVQSLIGAAQPLETEHARLLVRRARAVLDCFADLLSI